MKTFRSKSRFIAKPPAKVQAMAKKYGTLEIAKKEPYGPNLLKDGYGVFSSDTESAIAFPNNTIGWDSDEGLGALKITFVDDGSGARIWLDADTGDLTSNLSDGTSYLVTINVKGNFAGAAGFSLRINDGSQYIKALSDGEYIITTQEITKGVGVVPYIYLRYFFTGQTCYIDYYTIQEIL